MKGWALFENHRHLIALDAVCYNFIRIHKTLRVAPAMQAGVVAHLMLYEDLIEIVDEWEANQRTQQTA
jgi:hypothetical protein